ncbi:hypothetical protein GIB67_006664 [Kingdonia uniflora]|uniref:Patatin n=1 Tax=Kingdonia uniflora TaxID=39325 RepID=A0A7J7LAM0_9MAGN|nr:hypothetical protein GIB67_006664 [Kingdonia uniflora]
MSCTPSSEMQEPSIDTDKLSYEIFSILESKFLFGYDEQKLWLPKQSLEGETTPPNNHVSAIKNQRGKICILSIDGGGMRGVISGKALAYLEQALKSKSGDENARIADYFDVAAGTGVGGVFTAMLFGTKGENRPIFKADDTWKLLVEQGRRFCNKSSNSTSSSSSHHGSCGPGFFKKRTGSSKSGLDRVMREAFSGLTLKDTLKPVLIPCYDLSSSAPFLFSRADALESESYNFRLSEICCATTAEPTVFDPVYLQSVDGQTKCLAVDGGLTMGNPTAAAITHVLHNKQEFPFVRGVEDLLVISIGSGQLLEASYDNDKVKGWKARDWAKPMARIAGDGNADLVDHSVAMAFGQTRSSSYVRIQANGSNMCRGGMNVDCDPSSKNVNMLVGIAEEMLNQKNVESVLFGGKKFSDQTNFEKLDWFAGELVLEHQRRSCRIAPTVAFKQATPRSR